MLKISQDIVNAIIRQAKDGLPHEICGYLAGKDGRVSAHYQLTNTDAAADHFSMDPQEQFAAVKDMREKGLTMQAVYHSHPETPARPSQEDIKLAFDPNISYVIISMATAEADIKSFRINKGEVSAEPIKISSAGDKKMTTIKADAEKNCRGVGCPMNMVYTKVELAKLKSGQILELFLDDGAPVNNVPKSVEKEGHTIIAREQQTDGTWRLLIKKA